MSEELDASEAHAFLVGMLSGIGIGAALSLIVVTITPDHTQLDAIKHNAAHYDPKTGAFTWKQPEAKP